METLIITKEHLNEQNEYKHSHSLSFDGHIVIEENLGIVRFHGSVCARGRVLVKSGSGIEAGGNICAESIESDLDLRAGCGIEANAHIRCGGSIQAGENIKASEIQAGEDIEADWDVEASTNIRAGVTIDAGTIRAGAGISARYIYSDNIYAGDSIEAEESINARLDIHAGGVYAAGRISGRHIKCREGIVSGEYIDADRLEARYIDADYYIHTARSIVAGESIEAGSYIECGESIHAGDRIHVGGDIYADTIECARLQSGTVASGTLRLIPHIG